MSPFAQLKRLSISSVKNAKSSNTEANSRPAPILDIAEFTEAPQTLSPGASDSPFSPLASSPTTAEDGIAELLDDDNMSWGKGKPQGPRSKRRASSLIPF